MIAWWLLGAFALGTTVYVVSNNKPSGDDNDTTPRPTPSSVPLDNEAVIAKWMSQARKSQEEITKALAAKAKESNDRIEKIRAIGRYIPVIGLAWDTLVDIGVWAGKVLGSNYKDENSQEDIDYAANQLAMTVERGWIPPAYRPSMKSGMNSYGLMLHQLFVGATEGSAIENDACVTIGSLTIKWANDTHVGPILERMGTDDKVQGQAYSSENGGGTFGVYGWSKDCTSLLAALVFLETGRGDIGALQKQSKDLYTSFTGYYPARAAKTFIGLLKGATASDVGAAASGIVDATKPIILFQPFKRS